MRTWLTQQQEVFDNGHSSSVLNAPPSGGRGVLIFHKMFLSGRNCEGWPKILSKAHIVFSLALCARECVFENCFRHHLQRFSTQILNWHRSATKLNQRLKQCRISHSYAARVRVRRPLVKRTEYGTLKQVTSAKKSWAVATTE